MHETADRRDRCLILRGNGFIRCGIKDVLSAFHIPLEAWNALKTFYTKTDEAIASPKLVQIKQRSRYGSASSTQ
ncbi:hypothetical protein E4U51_002772 [Claviceps purpurea]|nr:hypothetical protein E4U51_002772 [Claviceps purpurea]